MQFLERQLNYKFSCTVPFPVSYAPAIESLHQVLMHNDDSSEADVPDDLKPFLSHDLGVSVDMIASTAETVLIKIESTFDANSIGLPYAIEFIRYWLDEVKSNATVTFAYSYYKDFLYRVEQGVGGGAVFVHADGFSWYDSADLIPWLSCEKSRIALLELKSNLTE